MSGVGEDNPVFLLRVEQKSVAVEYRRGELKTFHPFCCKEKFVFRKLECRS